MKLKPGVRLHGICNELTIGLMVANQVYINNGFELTITSIVDGTHSNTSLHYAGAAADLRTRDLPREEVKRKIRNEIKEALGIDFDVILESDHIHLEYQPRKS